MSDGTGKTRADSTIKQLLIKTATLATTPTARNSLLSAPSTGCFGIKRLEEEKKTSMKKLRILLPFKSKTIHTSSYPHEIPSDPL